MPAVPGQRPVVRKTSTQSGNAGQLAMFRERLRNECRRRNLITHRMLTPQAHPMNDGLSLPPSWGRFYATRGQQAQRNGPARFDRGSDEAAQAALPWKTGGPSGQCRPPRRVPGRRFSQIGRDRSLASSVGTYMDRQTKRELWILAIGTILFEAPFLAVAALALAGH
jgi:hypothetical protein